MPDTCAPDAHRVDDTADPPRAVTTETLETPHVPQFEAEEEPTTLSMPIIGAASVVVVDEADTGSRSIEALTLSPRRAKLALFVLATAAFAASANEASIVALSQSIATGLAVPVASIGLVATAFALTVVAAATPLTLLTAKASKRVTLSVTMGVWTVGVLIAAMSQNLVQLTGGRIVSAAAHALFWALVAPTAASMFAPHLRARTVTRIMVGAAAAGVVGTPLVTFSGTSFGWHTPYWGLAILGAVLTASLALALPGHVSSRGHRNVQHTRGDVPSRRMFAKVLTVTFAATAGMSASWTYIVPFFTKQAGLDISSLPAVFALGGIVAVATTLAVAPFLARNVVQTVRVSLGLLAIAWALLAIASPWSAIAAEVLLAAGWAALLAALINWAMRHTPWRTDVGASTYTMAMNSGGALGPLVGAAIVAAWGTRALPLVSLGLTAAAAIVTTTIDARMLRRLRVPRRLRRAVQARFAMVEKRRAWTQRTRPIALRPRGRATSFTRGSVRARRALRRSVDPRRR
ncbi:MFS transporter [Demequina lutea]|uniref:DHA1 family inner membrane transport protein n=1 Tax=Demequina lutea TaxID=431489 RepID=A0A7Y9ZC54_9MICO|nr:MFS transporter [Demequina lutea]NYI41898.1 DHA1 family inner membrane transport protein [Demequina lutea]